MASYELYLDQYQSLFKRILLLVNESYEFNMTTCVVCFDDNEGLEIIFTFIHSRLRCNAKLCNSPKLD